MERLPEELMTNSVIWVGASVSIFSKKSVCLWYYGCNLCIWIIPKALLMLCVNYGNYQKKNTLCLLSTFRYKAANYTLWPSVYILCLKIEKSKGKKGKYLSVNVMVLKHDDLTAFFIFRWHVKAKVITILLYSGLIMFREEEWKI